MRRWGWRSVFGAIAISVIVISCAAAHTPQPEMARTNTHHVTDFPPVTLTLRGSPIVLATPTIIQPVVATHAPMPTLTPLSYRSQPGDTLWQVARSFGISENILNVANAHITPEGTLSPGTHLDIPQPNPSRTSQLAVRPPTCHYTVTDVLTCFGLVENPRSAATVGRVGLTFELFDAAGGLVSALPADLEQYKIPSGAQAPYRAIITPPDLLLSRVTRIVVSVREVTVMQTPSADNAPPPNTLNFDRVDSEFADGKYILRTALRNPGGLTSAASRIVMTVQDAQGQVVGYRVLDIPPMPPRSTRPLTLTVLPYTTKFPPLTHTLHLDVLP